MIDLNALARVNRQTKSYYKPPTEKQVKFAKELGHEEPDTLSAFALSKWIEAAKEAQKKASNEAFDRANQYDFLTIAEGYTELKKDSQSWYSGPCPMPTCKAGDDGFYVNGQDNRGGCRRCGWNKSGGGSGPVGFIMALMSLEAHEARDYILGESLKVDLPKFEKKKRQIKVKEERVRQDFSDVQRAAYERLYAGDELAEWALSYYAKRGIKQKVLTHYGIGVCVDYDRSFVCAPFFSDVDLMLCAIRYSNEKTSRKGSMFRGSSFGLDCIRGHELAVIIEGENNALSIWQELDELGYQADVISPGNESAMLKPLDMLMTHLSKAKRLIIWADKKTISEKVAEKAAKLRPDMSIISLNSGEIEGQKGKIDANDLLLTGELSKLLAHILPDDLSVLEPSADNTVTRDALISVNEPIRAALSDADCIEAMNATLTVSLERPIVEQGHEARLELLLRCGFICEELGTDEALTLYREAEDIAMSQTLTELYQHYEVMRRLTASHIQAHLISNELMEG